MKIHNSWEIDTLNTRSGYYVTDSYVITRNHGAFDGSKKIISIGNNNITPRVDYYFPLGSQLPLTEIEETNLLPLSRTILCSSQYNVNNNRTEINKEFVTKFDYGREYLKNLKSSMYCLSPHGHTPDCYRHWEAMYMGCIPITIKHEVLENFYDLPMLFLDSWDELTEELLLSKYEELLPRFSSEKLEEEYWVNLLETL